MGSNISLPCAVLSSDVLPANNNREAATGSAVDEEIHIEGSVTPQCDVDVESASSNPSNTAYVANTVYVADESVDHVASKHAACKTPEPSQPMSTALVVAAASGRSEVGDAQQLSNAALEEGNRPLPTFPLPLSTTQEVQQRVGLSSQPSRAPRAASDEVASVRNAVNFMGIVSSPPVAPSATVEYEVKRPLHFANSRRSYDLYGTPPQALSAALKSHTLSSRRQSGATLCAEGSWTTTVGDRKGGGESVADGRSLFHSSHTFDSFFDPVENGVLLEDAASGPATPASTSLQHRKRGHPTQTPPGVFRASHVPLKFATRSPTTTATSQSQGSEAIDTSGQHSCASSLGAFSQLLFPRMSASQEAREQGWCSKYGIRRDCDDSTNEKKN